MEGKMKKCALAVGGALVAALAGVANADPVQLWGHGGFVTHPGQGAGGWDVSMSAPDPNIAGWNVLAANSARIADRFEITGTWGITSIVTYAYQTNAATPTWAGFNANIWDGSPDDPNSNVVATLSSASIANTEVYRVFSGMENLSSTARPIHSINWDTAGITLGTGQYWFDWQVEGGSSAWAPPVTLADPDGGVNTTEPAGFGLHFFGGQWTGGGNGFDYPLEVYGVPAPGALALLALAGLVGARRRRE